MNTRFGSTPLIRAFGRGTDAPAPGRFTRPEPEFRPRRRKVAGSPAATRAIKRTAGKALLACAILGLSLGVCSAKEGAIQCANLIYGGTHTSRCFSDEFLSAVQRDTTIATERRFKAVKLASDELFRYPFVVMTGEADFHLSARERENLKKYLTNGGFLLASAGCSNKDWDRAFRREFKAMFPDQPLKKVPMGHAMFSTVYKIDKLKLHHPAPEPSLEGLECNGKFVCLYSPHGLNDTEHTEGCCCCGGNEITNSMQVNVDLFVYALIH